MKIIDVELQKEAEQSYLAYAMSVIVGRALPDVRDGLKPVHRRILFAMHDLGLLPTKPYRKCARVVGEVLGKYHPHGDSAVYEALVRMAQGFSMRAPLVAGHGNFGSLDNDPPAAMRYTECRLQAVSSAVMLADLAYDTVDFAPNFDNSQEEPRVLPARVPNLLVNGSSGIAVSIATKIPPHNLREVVAGLHALIDNPDITVAELMQHIPAPDFPTGAHWTPFTQILASGGIRDAYEHGKGSITVRGRAFIEGNDAGAREKVLKPSIIVTELPYQTNKADFVAKVAALVEEQKLTGISDVRDESDRDGMRVVVELSSRGGDLSGNTCAQVVLNNLYKQTTLQSNFSVNSVALVNGTPQTLNLKEFLTNFLDFRCQIIKRRARFDLRKAQTRQHIVKGLLLALADLDKVVVTVRAAKDGAAASKDLQQEFGLSPEQADAVLSMALRRLTSLEAGKLREEEATLAQTLAQLQSLLGSQQLVLDTIKRESQEIADKFGDSRRTAVRMDESGQLSVEDVIPNRASLLVFSRRGYIKRMPTDLFSVQGRGGRGVSGARMREDDTVEEVAHVMDHDTVLFFSPDGICRALKAYQIPQSSRTAAGTPLTQARPLTDLGKGARVASIMSLGEFSDDDFLVMLTKNGLIKRTPMKLFANVRGSLTAIKLRPGDELMWVERCVADDSVLLASSDGTVIRFPTSQLTPQSRVAQGLKSMVLADGARLVGMSVLPAGLTAPEASGSETDEEPLDDDDQPEELADSPVPSLLLVTENGLGKRVPLDMFRSQRRGGKGRRGIKLNDGDSLSAVEVHASNEEMLLTTAGGMMNRTAVSTIRRSSRMARGVNVANLQEGDSVQAITILRPNVED
ncbi:DNA gyrase, A subunit [Coccomyxa subellipsoidea C-169]|uniref:DNA topoisomerase (ATP-hydrolyzing) n=1 Tax=Coccomyxa subellipsoidea (strain C-169) TaxID=574566 RepID=I0YQD9_COCSC|nr:DNA gyrase, A subunit [Coccomyxa subellipsoidea C-169]EIE20608.1 DNA gyrase, A subunit [Coccomyxa subellipsoidea C-169]|eukprot:XP_005645152.1 DNA gyrase, A subunit [Coccomyxa subellipsoidea C-169]